MKLTKTWQLFLYIGGVCFWLLLAVVVYKGFHGQGVLLTGPGVRVPVNATVVEGRADAQTVPTR